MGKKKIEILLKDYPDNVREVINWKEKDIDNKTPSYRSLLCDPEITEEDLKTALQVLKERGDDKTREKEIERELKIRRQEPPKTPWTQDLKAEWAKMQKAAERVKRKANKWITLETKTPKNGEYVLVSFENAQSTLAAIWREDKEGGAFYIPLVERPFTSLDYYINAWMPMPKPYKPEKDTESCIERTKR